MSSDSLVSSRDEQREMNILILNDNTSCFNRESFIKRFIIIYARLIIFWFFVALMMAYWIKIPFIRRELDPMISIFLPGYSVDSIFR
jgi:hypothetical protein